MMLSSVTWMAGFECVGGRSIWSLTCLSEGGEFVVVSAVGGIALLASPIFTAAASVRRVRGSRETASVAGDEDIGMPSGRHLREPSIHHELAVTVREPLL